MKKRYLTKIPVLLGTITLSLCGCSSTEYTDLMQLRNTNENSPVIIDTITGEVDNTSTQTESLSPATALECPVGEDFVKPEIAITDFGVRLFQNSVENETNTLLSPLSILFALSMTANGAQGNTLTQMEYVLGMPVDQLNTCLKLYMDALPDDDTYQLKAANSIWFKDDPNLTVKDTFLQTNADYYDAGIYKVPFDDTALKSINGWVKENTDGMIPMILDEIPADAVMYLINALAFDAEWEKIYKESSIRTKDFTLEDGTVRQAELMYSEEKLFLEDDLATGFIKYYDDKAYAFAALLPKEGVSVTDYVASLTGEHLQKLLNTPESVTVHAAIPKFECEYSTELSELLSNMGMPDAFRGDTADFSALGSSTAGNLYIGRVLHKTFLTLDEKGTKAGAVTAVEMKKESAEIDTRTVTLNRPFVYMLIDCECQIPIFMGTLMDVEKQ